MLYLYEEPTQLTLALLLPSTEVEMTLLKAADLDEAKTYQAENDEEDHADSTEEDLEDAIDALMALLHSGKGALRKNWSDEAREAAAAARGKSSKMKTMAAKHTGLAHSAMNKQGFIKTEGMEGDLLNRARDHNNARAGHLKARKNFLYIIQGKKEGDAKEAGAAYKAAGQRLVGTGAHFRMAMSP